MAVGIKKGREFGMDMCTWLYLKWMTNCGGPTVDSTWNSAECHVATWMRGESLGENGNMSMRG